MTFREAELTADVLSDNGHAIAGIIHVGIGYGVALMNGDWTDEPWQAKPKDASQHVDSTQVETVQAASIDR